MKILYSSLKYTNFDERLGLSYERRNFYDALGRMEGVEVLDFPYERILEVGLEKGNAELLDLVRRERPDLFFAFMFTDELQPEILDKIKKITTSIAWFSDDHWRFWNYSRHYAPHFTWVVTTWSRATDLYKKHGIKNVIRSQWAANASVYKPTDWKGPGDPPEVAFVGTWSKPRQKIISALAGKGIPVSAYGSGWPLGRITDEKMLQIFSNAKINLALNPAPGFFNKNSLGRLFFHRSMDKIVPDFHFKDNFRSWLHRDVSQIKGRHFEIPACGGFVITEAADDLENYYKFGEEIVVYENIADLADKIRYFLKNEAEREKIAKAALGRTLKNHTYEARLREIFRKVSTIGI